MKAVIEQKQTAVGQLANDFQKAKSFLFFEYQGLNAKQITLLRKNLHAANAKMYVAKNNIFTRAFKQTHAASNETLAGPNALIISFSDEVIPFKEIANVIKANSKIKYKFGMIGNETINSGNLSTIANIPSREGLYAMLLSCLQASIRNLAYGINAIAKTKQ